MRQVADWLDKGRSPCAVVWAVLLLFTVSPRQAMPQSLSPEQLIQEVVPLADHRLSYGSERLQFGELRLPKSSGPHPIAIIIHGGCWVDRLPGRDPRITSFELLRPFAAALASIGIATWNIEYRRAGDAGGGWPGSFRDLARATDFLRTIAPKYVLDLKRVIPIGHSAGGQLALWLAARPKLPTSSPLYENDPLTVKAALDIDGPPDLASAQPEERKFCPVAGIEKFLGGTPSDRPERYREGSVAAWLPIGIPQMIVTGALLAGAPNLVSGYQERARASDDNVTVLALDGSGHFDMLHPRTKYYEELQARVLPLLR
jgi:acetyl esterase/lipase